ncbi:MAG: NAD-dependent epimerase/dehydratase family protein [Candidatus Lokiarchaeota archaeon]|nr:NAD-dependent epimerase/dehydratase family protein [Candidatus Lokiarchaeota archaeon]MBD3201489.1 NAD-dependent epimerase/dehydratase family protein [Candidatus Lokiarchaeota archaeon]
MYYDINQDISEISKRFEEDGITFKDKTILVTGGAGFLGSWVCDVLVKQGAYCICIDNLTSGSTKNILHLMDEPNFRFLNHDISQPIFFGLSHHPDGICVGDIKKLDIVMHMASRASPFEFKDHPISILKSNTLGTMNALGIAKAHNAIFFYTSTSEVYGNPPDDAIPTSESYYGHVNPVGPRSCYDESKRAGEAFIKAYELQHKMRTKIVRIFNTSGPRIRHGPEYGRVIPNFINQALNDQDITVFGNGSQTRSFTYVIDEIEGFLKMVYKDEAIGEVINLGNDKEYTILELAKIIIKLTDSNSKISFKPLPIDDPRRRCPDLSKAKRILEWEPKTPLKEGLKRTIAWFKDKYDWEKNE